MTIAPKLGYRGRHPFGWTGCCKFALSTPHRAAGVSESGLSSKCRSTDHVPCTKNSARVYLDPYRLCFQSGRLKERNDVAIKDGIVIQNGIAIWSRLGVTDSGRLVRYCKLLNSHRWVLATYTAYHATSPPSKLRRRFLHEAFGIPGSVTTLAHAGSPLASPAP